MGALMLLCGFFFFIPVLALFAVLAAVAILIGVGGGLATLAGGLITWFATVGGAMQVSKAAAKVLPASRERPSR